MQPARKRTSAAAPFPDMTTVQPAVLLFTLGDPASFGGFALIPLSSRTSRGTPTLASTRRPRTNSSPLRRPRAALSKALHVSNPLNEGVLLYEGKELAGAKQRASVWKPSDGLEPSTPPHHGGWSIRRRVVKLPLPPRSTGSTRPRGFRRTDA